MMQRWRVGLSGALMALSVMACNLQGIPVTPTLAPTRAITQTAIVFPPTETPSPSPSATVIPPSLTPTPSRTVINLIPTTATHTPTPSPTFTASVMPSLTLTFTVTSTPTSTDTVTVLPSVISTATLAPSPTLEPSPTTLVGMSATPLDLVTTHTPFPTMLLVFATSTLPPTRTPSPAPVTPFTLLVTPTLAPLNIPATNLPGTPMFIAPLPTATLPIAIAGIFPTAISLDDRAEYVEIPEGSVQRPAPDGEISAYDLNRQGRRAEIRRDGRMTIDGGIYVGDNKHTRQQFVAARWSPDGNWLAYIVQTPGAVERQLSALLSIDDGVWVLEAYNPTAKPRHVLRNHYVPGSNEYPYRVALNVSWSPDSDAILVDIIGQGGVPGVVLTGKGRFANERQAGLFQTLPYTGATWLSRDGWIAATNDPNQPTQIGLVSRDNAAFNPIVNGAAIGLGISYPVVLADGRIAFLGRPSPSGRLENGALGLQLYVYAPGGVPQQVSIPLEGVVLSAEWNPSRTALLVNLRAYDGALRAAVMGINGGISYLSSGSPSVSWRR